VTLVYRRGEAQMKASEKERQWAQLNGVTIRLWAAPLRFEQHNNRLTGVVFSVVREGEVSDETFTLEADMVLKAIGQTFDSAPLDKPFRSNTDVLSPTTAVAPRWRASGPGDCCGRP
jgi:glutamate synthase (NADPH/NADH) small chain